MFRIRTHNRLQPYGVSGGGGTPAAGDKIYFGRRYFGNRFYGRYFGGTV